MDDSDNILKDPFVEGNTRGYEETEHREEGVGLEKFKRKIG